MLGRNQEKMQKKTLLLDFWKGGVYLLLRFMWQANPSDNPQQMDPSSRILGGSLYS